ncbi:MAG: acetyl-CoA carboxylase carboxyltransferase subunit alpha [bacterium]|nr:acetyl-CoA carboxylase carboxyltransferase subunit alpha [bacterium]
MPAPRKPGFQLEFEAPILHLEAKIREFKQLAEEGGVDLGEEVRRLEERAAKLRKAVYDHLTPGQKIQIARHPARPTALDYIQTMTDSFFEMHGDRMGHDDHAIVGGIGRFEGRSVMFIGHQKGRNTRDNIHRNFGMAHPEGYRKAMRLMRHAARFGMPIVTLIDTPGAYPGIAAEERGQAHAIAESLALMATLEVPIVSVVIGEGSSGGAIGIGMGNRVFMFEHAYYAVISPEGCAAILWKDPSHATQAAKILKLTSHDLLDLGVIDAIIPEPVGGCHREAMQSSRSLARTVSEALEELGRMNAFQLLEHRHDRYRRMGQVAEVF